jgi:hypothetical protein
MVLDAIKALPVADFAAPNGWLFLWTTWPMLMNAGDVAKAWGFTYAAMHGCGSKRQGRQAEDELRTHDPQVHRTLHIGKARQGRSAEVGISARYNLCAAA